MEPEGARYGLEMPAIPWSAPSLVHIILLRNHIHKFVCVCVFVFACAVFYCGHIIVIFLWRIPRNSVILCAV